MNILKTLDEVDALIAEGEALSPVVMEIKETDTIKANIARMPITSLSIDFLVEVLEPVRLVPRVISVSTHASMMLRSERDQAPEQLLEKELLREWNDHINDGCKLLTPEELEKVKWMRNVTKVQLVECDLLVPKVQS